MAQYLVGSLSRWLVHEASRLADVGAIVRQLAERLIANGVPVARASAHFGILDPRYIGISRIWTPDEGLRLWRAEHADTVQDFRQSPLQHVRHHEDWIDIRLDRDSSLDFPVFSGLRQAGMTHYMMAPLRFSDGTIQAASWATRRPGGFRPEEKTLIRALVGPLALVIELKRLRIMSAAMLAKYVGRDPAERILSGTVQRGDLVYIRAALMFTDLVGFTASSQQESAQQVVDRLNRYFESVDHQVKKKGGEILKFLGDGVFAVFPEGEGFAAQRAFEAARDCLADAPDPMRIALHLGEIAYGNVGSPERLDFTAIGPDVNLLSRLLEHGRVLGEAMVVSRAVADAIPDATRSVGSHATRGFADPVEIFAPVTDL